MLSWHPCRILKQDSGKFHAVLRSRFAWARVVLPLFLDLMTRAGNYDERDCVWVTQSFPQAVCYVQSPGDFLRMFMRCFGVAPACNVFAESSCCVVVLQASSGQTAGRQHRDAHEH